MESSIRQRLFVAEDDFRQAAAHGSTSLNSFHDKWSALLNDMESAIQAGELRHDTIALGNTVASRVAILSEYLLDFQSAVDRISSTLHTELETLFARIEIGDDDDSFSSSIHTSSGETSFRSTALPTRQSNSGTCERRTISPYIEVAYNWLLRNLHNPYPSRDIRDAISRETGSDRKVIDSWFIDIRKRIGWNTLRKQRFANKRVGIVEAATQFFLSGRVMHPHDETMNVEFAGIEASAKDLYSDRFSQSALAAKLDVVVRGFSGMKTRFKVDEKHQRRQGKDAKHCLEEDIQAASYYPSPVRSPSGTPDLLPCSPLPDAIKISHHNANSNRKRCALSHDCISSLNLGKPAKRPRIDALSPHEIVEAVEDITSTQPQPLPMGRLHAVSKTSCKRRLSGAGGQGTPKRPRNSIAGPRLHAVSDPLPRSSTLSAWFQDNFGIGNMASVDEFDTSTPFEVELFNYADITTQLSVPLSQSPDPRNHTLDGSFRLRSFETSLAAPEAEAYLLNISTNDFNHSELFSQPDENPTEALMHNAVNQPSKHPFPAFDPHVFEQSSTQNVFESGFATPDTAIIADTSEPIMQSSDSTFDWIFPSVLSSNMQESIQDLGCYGLPRDESLGFSLRKTGVQDVSKDVIPCISTEIDKAAKRRKLIEMKEATRRLEAEIAAS